MRSRGAVAPRPPPRHTLIRLQLGPSSLGTLSCQTFPCHDPRVWRWDHLRCRNRSYNAISRLTRPAARSHAYTQKTRERNDTTNTTVKPSVYRHAATVGGCHATCKAPQPAASDTIATPNEARNTTRCHRRPTG